MSYPETEKLIRKFYEEMIEALPSELKNTETINGINARIPVVMAAIGAVGFGDSKSAAMLSTTKGQETIGLISKFMLAHNVIKQNVPKEDQEQAVKNIFSPPQLSSEMTR